MEIGSFNQHQKAIETLIEEGHTILQIINPDNSAFYFTVMEFKEAFKSPAMSVDFNSIKGINITDFLRINGAQPDRSNLLARFREVMERGNVVRIDFSTHTPWFKWGSASR